MKRGASILAIFLVVSYLTFAADRSKGEEPRFHSDEADYSLQLAEGWEYDSEVRDFFVVPADGWVKGTSRFQVSQPGLGCTSDAEWAEMLDYWSQPWGRQVVQPVAIAGISGVYIVTMDSPNRGGWRQYFGQSPIVEVVFLFRHDCHAWRIELQAEQRYMHEAVPEFTNMLNSFRLDEGFFQRWLPGV